MRCFPSLPPPPLHLCIGRHPRMLCYAVLCAGHSRLPHDPCCSFFDSVIRWPQWAPRSNAFACISYSMYVCLVTPELVTGHVSCVPRYLMLWSMPIPHFQGTNAWAIWVGLLRSCMPLHGISNRELRDSGVAACDWVATRFGPAIEGPPLSNLEHLEAQFLFWCPQPPTVFPRCRGGGLQGPERDTTREGGEERGRGRGGVPNDGKLGACASHSTRKKKKGPAAATGQKAQEKYKPRAPFFLVLIDFSIPVVLLFLPKCPRSCDCIVSGFICMPTSGLTSIRR